VPESAKVVALRAIAGCAIAYLEGESLARAREWAVALEIGEAAADESGIDLLNPALAAPADPAV
jgi:hypothetical protein